MFTEVQVHVLVTERDQMQYPAFGQLLDSFVVPKFSAGLC